MQLAIENYFDPKTTTVNMVNLKSGSFIIIMLLHEGLTRVRSQKKPRLHFADSFTLTQNQLQRFHRETGLDGFKF